LEKIKSAKKIENFILQCSGAAVMAVASDITSLQGQAQKKASEKRPWNVTLGSN
jgi:hypothetical protein